MSEGLLQTVRDAWAQALGHRDFTDDEAFFVVGGNSIKAIRVTTTVGTAVGLRLKARLLFDHQTVRELAAAVALLLGGTAGGPVDGTLGGTARAS